MPCQGLTTSRYRLECVRTEIADPKFFEQGEFVEPFTLDLSKEKKLIDSDQNLLV